MEGGRISLREFTLQPLTVRPREEVVCVVLLDKDQVLERVNTVNGHPLDNLIGVDNLNLH